MLQPDKQTESRIHSAESNSTRAALRRNLVPVSTRTGRHMVGHRQHHSGQLHSHLLLRQQGNPE